jgi:hypothetical protein
MELIVVVLSGGLAGLIASLITRLIVRSNNNRWRVLETVIFVIVFALVSALSRAYVLPLVRGYELANALDQMMAQNILFQQVAKYEPELYQDLRREWEQAARSGKSQAELIAIGRDKTAPLMNKYGPVGSDEALLNMIKLITEIGEKVAAQNPTVCHALFFPEPGQGVIATKYTSKEQNDAMFQILAELIRTGAENPTKLTDTAKAEKSLEKVITKLVGVYGKDLALLENPKAPQVDKAKMCRMLLDLFDEILKLPKEESVPLLRFLLSS